ncbi:MAG: tetratricopeptide repeat protein [Candidatus Alcyoniella australis]|nr:tetratricopeptide repeat protein [Candidatus Alcyoniella australis]
MRVSRIRVIVVVLALALICPAAHAATERELLQLFAAGNVKWLAEPLLKAAQEIAQIQNPGSELEKFHGLCLLKVGYIRLYEGNADQAQRYILQSVPRFEAALRHKPKDIEAMFGRAMAYITLAQMGPQLMTRYAPDVDLALQAMDGVDPYHFLSIEAKAARGLVLPAQLGGDPAKSEVDLELLLQYEPENTEVLCWLAVAQSRNGHDEQARATLKKVLAINPDHLRAKKLLQRM